MLKERERIVSTFIEESRLEDTTLEIYDGKELKRVKLTGKKFLPLNNLITFQRLLFGGDEVAHDICSTYRNIRKFWDYNNNIDIELSLALAGAIYLEQMESFRMKTEYRNIPETELIPFELFISDYQSDKPRIFVLYDTSMFIEYKTLFSKDNAYLCNCLHGASYHDLFMPIIKENDSNKILVGI